jgi:hypothetical protein
MAVLEGLHDTSADSRPAASLLRAWISAGAVPASTRAAATAAAAAASIRPCKACWCGQMG